MPKFVVVGYYKIPVYLEYEAENQDDAERLMSKVSPPTRKHISLEGWNGNKKNAQIEVHNAVPKKDFDKAAKEDPSAFLYKFLD